MRRRVLQVAMLGLMAVAMPRPVSADEPALVGRWLTERANAVVQIGPCTGAGAGQVCGTIVWLWQPNDDSGRPRRDTENQAADRRDRPLIGTEILTGFAAKSPGYWAGGRIYNPEDGRTYDANLRLNGADALVVEGCVLFICKKQSWRRASAVCPPG